MLMHGLNMTGKRSSQTKLNGARGSLPRATLVKLCCTHHIRSRRRFIKGAGGVCEYDSRVYLPMAGAAQEPENVQYTLNKALITETATEACMRS